MIKRLFVDTAYKINTSNKYADTKRFVYNLLENNNYRYKKIFDLFMITLIFASVIILIREVKSHVNDHLLFFNNYIISIIFFIEYVFRLWISSSVTEVIIKQSEYDSMLGDEFNIKKALKDIAYAKLKYIFSLKAMVDLLAIIPLRTGEK